MSQPDSFNSAYMVGLLKKVGQLTKTMIHDTVDIPVNTVTEIKVGLTKLANRHKVSIYVIGNGTVYYGGPAVTVANGFPIQVGSERVWHLDTDESVGLYVITTDTGMSMRVVEEA